MREGGSLSVNRDERLSKLALFAPATDFFRAPGALDGVRVPILAWAGTKDTITPPAQTEFLKEALQGRVAVEVRVEDGAGHFSFMNVPPPNVEEPLSNRDAFLARVTTSLLSFALA